MSVISLAIIGKNIRPIFLKEFFDENSASDLADSEAELFGLTPPASKTLKDPSNSVSCSIRQQFLLHAALDRFEQLNGPLPGCAWRAPGVVGTDAMFVGLLCPVEDMRIYGTYVYCTDTE